MKIIIDSDDKSVEKEEDNDGGDFGDLNKLLVWTGENKKKNEKD